MFVPGKSFQPSLIFVGKARSPTANIRVGWRGLTRTDTLSYSENHNIAIYEGKKFYIIRNWCLYYITFYDRYLQMFTVSQSIRPFPAFPALPNVCW